MPPETKKKKRLNSIAAKKSRRGSTSGTAVTRTKRLAASPKLVSLPKEKRTASVNARRRSKFHGGTYVTPKGNLSLGIPSFWSLRQTNDDLEVESPSTETSVIVTAFQRKPNAGKLDAREYLKQFLRTASTTKPIQGQGNSAGRAESRF